MCYCYCVISVVMLLQVDRQVHIRGLVLAADRLAGVDGFLRGEGSLRQVQLLLPLISERQLPGLEQDARLPVGKHLVDGDVSVTSTLVRGTW